MNLRILLLAFLAGLSSLAAQDHVGHYGQADVERGQRLYGNNCQLCHGFQGDNVPNVDLRSGKFRHATSDEDLSRVIVAGIPGTAMPPHKFDTSEVTGMVAFIRSMRDINVTATVTGDAQRGKALYEGKGQCSGCHRIRGQGSRFGPDLTEIGAVRPADIIEKSLVDPTAAMLPMMRSVRAVTRDGKTITGRRLNEDTYSVQLIDRQEHLLSLSKPELKDYEVLKTSAMPSYRDKLTDPERADLLAYLLSLKGGN